jgi:MobA/VirD2-like, nuclease domain
MALHTDQSNPHVHMIVKAENEDGRRLHIDKEMLRHWREDFAELMREQGIAANATSRPVRGRNERKMPDPIYRAKQRGASTVVRQRITEVARELSSTGSFSDPARARLLETRKAVLHSWLNIADTLDIQGESILADEVRHFARHLPRVLTDKEQIAAALVDYSQKRPTQVPAPENARDKAMQRTR